MITASWAARLIVFAAFFDLFSQFPLVAPYARALGADPLMIGIAVAAYDATNLIGNLSTPFVLRRWGRKRSLMAGLLLAAGSLLLYGWVTSIVQFALVRALHGAAQAILSPGAFVVMSESVPGARRARAMGMAGVLIATAAVLAPPVAGIVADRADPRTVFIGVAALLTTVAALLGWAAPLADVSVSSVGSPMGSPSGETDRRPQGVLATLLDVARRPVLLAAYAGALAWTAGIGTLVVHLPLVLEAQGAPASTRGGAFGLYAIVALVLMAGPSPWLANRFGRMLPLAGGLAIIGVSLLLLAVSASTAAVYGAMSLFGFGFGVLFPAATALVADATAPHERGAAYGIFYAIYSLGVVIGEVGSGQLSGALGSATVAPFLVFGVVALVFAPGILVAGRRSPGPLTRDRFSPAPSAP